VCRHQHVIEAISVHIHPVEGLTPEGRQIHKWRHCKRGQEEVGDAIQWRSRNPVTVAVESQTAKAPTPATTTPPVAPAAAKPASVAAGFPRRVGTITHFYPHAGAGIVALESGELRVGDTVHIRGHTTDYYQRIDRIELDHQPVEIARAGQVVGLHVSQRVREGDAVRVVST
jgi:hypothetical protein